ncbi:MAG: TetR/AcrR family transcriptional regulator, partial [Chloroflexi bacterium]
MSPKPDVSVERRQQIFMAAIRCFGRQGYHKTKMDDIAAEAGLSKGSLYWYFKSKKELFLALFQEIITQFEYSWQQVIVDDRKGATEKVLATLSLFRAEFDELTSFFGVMMEAWAQTLHDEDVQAILDGFYEPYVKMMTNLIEE